VTISATDATEPSFAQYHDAARALIDRYSQLWQILPVSEAMNRSETRFFSGVIHLHCNRVLGIDRSAEAVAKWALARAFDMVSFHRQKSLRGVYDRPEANS
jgi:hypothetical protein